MRYLIKLAINNSNVDIYKGSTKVLSVSTEEKTMKLSELYTALNIKLEDEFFFDLKATKIDPPGNDTERILNNVADFCFELFSSVNSKLSEIRLRQQMENENFQS